MRLQPQFFAGERLQFLVRVNGGYGGQKKTRVIMLWLFKHRSHSAGFDDLALVQDQYLIAEIPDNAEVVGNEQVSQSHLHLQVFEQAEHLRLHRYVECRNGFVADDQIRF